MYRFVIYNEIGDTKENTLKFTIRPCFYGGVIQAYRTARKHARMYAFDGVSKLEIYRDEILLQSESWWNHTCWTGETSRLHTVFTAPHRQHT